MIVSNGDILWSASDLTRAAECEFALLRQLDVKLGRIPAAKTAVDPLMDRIAEIGLEHEARELARLSKGLAPYDSATGRGVCLIDYPKPYTAAILAERCGQTLAALEAGDHDLSGLAAVNNGAAPLSPAVRARLMELLPHILVMDAAGSSETGLQMSSMSLKGMEAEAATFTPVPTTTVVAEDLSHVLSPDEAQGAAGGWLAQRGRVPLGYLGDAEKTARTFPMIDGERFSVPGDRAEMLEDGRIRLLGRDGVTINSGGEKIFAEEVERAVGAHPAVRDVVVVGRPSERWGSEPVAIVSLAAGREGVDDEELLATASEHIARYKLPKAILRVDHVVRSPSGKADYRWATEQVTG